MREAGFERVRTYGDFQETYQESEPDFFIHVAEKSVSPNCQLRDRRNGASPRRRRYPTQAFKTDESVMRNGH